MPFRAIRQRTKSTGIAMLIPVERFATETKDAGVGAVHSQKYLRCALRGHSG